LTAILITIINAIILYNSLTDFNEIWWVMCIGLPNPTGLLKI